MPAFLADEVMLLVANREPNELVFGSPEDGPLRHGNFYARHFKRAVLAAGLPPRTRFHDLRHTYASRLIAERASALTVMRRLGHSSIKVTYDTYGHLLPEQEDALTERLDAVVELRSRRSTTRPSTVRRGPPDTIAKSGRDCSDQVATFREPAVGIEPTTFALRVRPSAD